MANKHFLLLLLMMHFVAACAVGYTHVAKAPDSPLKSYKILELPDLTGGDQVPTEVKDTIPAIVAEQLAKENLFGQIDRVEGANKDSVLLLSGRIVQYNPGSRGMRYLTGPIWGVGRGSIIVNVKFVEKNSGKELADSSFEGEIKGGVFGGGINETYSKIAEEIVQFIKTNY